MKFTVEQTKKAKTAKSAEELFALAKENGIEMTEEEAAKYFAKLHKEGELADEELDNVAGGGCGDPTMYGTHFDWVPVCDGDFKFAANRSNDSVICGNCYYFQGQYHGYGACMREVW